MQIFSDHLPTIQHAGFLQEMHGIPSYLHPAGYQEYGTSFIWPYDSGGMSGTIKLQEAFSVSAIETLSPGWYLLRTYFFGQLLERRALLKANGTLEVSSPGPLALPGSVFLVELERENLCFTALLRETSLGWKPGLDSGEGIQYFRFYRSFTHRLERVIQNKLPVEGLAKLRVSMGEEPTLFPIQLSPSVLDVTGRRVPLFYQDAIERLAGLLLAHCPPYGQTLVYAEGDVDYFDQFALHEVLRLLGVRNLNGSAEFGLWAEARCQEFQTGNEAPVMTVEQALEGPDRLYLLSGWNGFISHLVVFNRLLLREPLDAWLIETCVTESAKLLAARLHPERILLIRSGTDGYLALSVAHEILHQYPGALDQSFISNWCERESLESYLTLARSEQFALERSAEFIAPDPAYTERLMTGIQHLAASLAGSSVPIHIPGAGLAQSSGMTAHGLWLNLFAMLGKIGLDVHGQLRGGVLRLPYQSNEETQVQGLAPDRFFGNIPLTEVGCKDAALRMELPESAYQGLLKEPSRATFDYFKPSQAGERTLILFIGQGLEKKLVNCARWQQKLKTTQTTLVVIDPTPGPFFLEHAALCLPTPPVMTMGRLLQNGEWRLTLSFPRRQAPAETRSVATLIYDAMAEISRTMRLHLELHESHPDLAEYARSGYLSQRFEPPEWKSGGTLVRKDGEVSRPLLWERIQAYLTGNAYSRGPLYCRPEHEDGHPLTWEEILQAGSLVYGGVGTSRYRRSENQAFFQNIYREARRFRFFVPKPSKLLEGGIILNSGGSTLSDDVRWMGAAILSSHANFTSRDIPKEPWLYVSETLAKALGLKPGQLVRVIQRESSQSFILPVKPTQRLKGAMVYLHRFHPDSQDMLNSLAYHSIRCLYSGVPLLKALQIELEVPQEEKDVD